MVNKENNNKTCLVGMAIFDNYISAFKRWFSIHNEKLNLPVYVITNNVKEFKNINSDNLNVIDIKDVCDKKESINKFEKLLYENESLPYENFTWNIIRYVIRSAFNDGYKKIIFFENDSVFLMDKTTLIEYVNKIPINHIGCTHQLFSNNHFAHCYDFYNKNSEYNVPYKKNNKLCSWEGPVFVLKFDDILYNKFLDAFDKLTPYTYLLSNQVSKDSGLQVIPHPQNLFCYLFELFDLKLFKWSKIVYPRHIYKGKPINTYTDNELKNIYDLGGVACIPNENHYN